MISTYVYPISHKYKVCIGFKKKRQWNIDLPKDKNKTEVTTPLTKSEHYVKIRVQENTAPASPIPDK